MSISVHFGTLCMLRNLLSNLWAQSCWYFALLFIFMRSIVMIHPCFLTLVICVFYFLDQPGQGLLILSIFSIIKFQFGQYSLFLACVSVLFIFALILLLLFFLFTLKFSSLSSLLKQKVSYSLQIFLFSNTFSSKHCCKLHSTTFEWLYFYYSVPSISFPF